MADALILMKKLRLEKKRAAEVAAEGKKESSCNESEVDVEEKEMIQSIDLCDNEIDSQIFKPSRQWDIGSKVGDNALLIYEDSVGISQAGNGATLWYYSCLSSSLFCSFQCVVKQA